MYTYEYPKASITTDCIIVHKDRILLIKRKNDPFKGMYALPGGYFDPINDEDIYTCACRELKEETGLDLCLDYFFYYDEKDRDPRDRTITFVFDKDMSNQLIRPTINAGDDVDCVEWVDIENLWYLNLAFDHKKILKDYFKVKVKQ